MSIRTALLVSIACCPGLALGAEPPDNQQHAHVHGIATVGIAVQDDLVTLTLESPLDSLIGFEHRATTPAERAAVDGLQSRMKSASGLFRLTPAAECKLTKAGAESAIFEPRASQGDDAHADLDGSFEFRCARVDRLTTVDIGLFEAYPRLQKIAVEVAGANGQFKRELTRTAHVVPMRR